MTSSLHLTGPSSAADAAADAGRRAVRLAPLAMRGEEFRRLGHELVDRLAEFYDGIPAGPVTTAESPEQIRQLIGGGGLPAEGRDAAEILREATAALTGHSLLNGHPRFWGYITSSPAPIGALGDLLAAAVNSNVGSFTLSPVATEVEAQVVRWIAELIGYPTTCGGLLVSGGNMANFVGFLAARRAKAAWDVRAKGLSAGHPRMTIYTSEETHTWIQKAADLFGFGLDAIRWVPVDATRSMRMDALRQRVADDRAAGLHPFLVIGTAGSVGFGAVDPLDEIADYCAAEGLWFHADGAYGAIAAQVDGAPPALRALARADSVAVDPHKWLYAPLEAGCALVRDPNHLLDAFSFHPTYFHFSESGTDAPPNYYELGTQNSRGFRALKVWLGLQQTGSTGAKRMVADDCALARAMAAALRTSPEFEVRSDALSIVTFRYVPPDLDGRADREAYLNALNTAILGRLEAGGEVFVSNAVMDGAYLLRACIVNFRTTRADVEALPGIVARVGREVDAELRLAGETAGAPA
jgi:aromatic-L-amino-acid/L-tryptophan decarboxylase